VHPNVLVGQNIAEVFDGRCKAGMVGGGFEEEMMLSYSNISNPLAV